MRMCTCVYVFIRSCIYKQHILYLQKRQVLTDLNELSEDIQCVLENHLSMFNISSTSGVEKIDEYVK